MKKGIKILLGISMIIMLVACSKSEKKSSSDKSNEEFYFEFSYWVNPNQKNIFSTKDDYIQKDLIGDGVVKKEWKISNKDILEIKKMIIDFNVVAIDKRVEASNYSTGDNFVISPSSENFCIKFLLDGKEYTIEGDETIYMISEGNEVGANICKFLKGLKEKLFSQQAYIDMPEAEGAYQ